LATPQKLSGKRRDDSRADSLWQRRSIARVEPFSTADFGRAFGRGQLRADAVSWEDRPRSASRRHRHDYRAPINDMLLASTMARASGRR